MQKVRDHMARFDRLELGLGAARVPVQERVDVDPLAAALLFIRPTIGIPLILALITTNVAHNLAILAMFSGAGELLSRATSSWTFLSQLAFMFFVVGAAPTAWKGRKVTARERAVNLIPS